MTFLKENIFIYSKKADHEMLVTYSIKNDHYIATVLDFGS